MRNFFLAVFCILTFSLYVQIDARSGCCSHHGGVCGCQCCDGTALSAVCDNCSSSNESSNSNSSYEGSSSSSSVNNTGESAQDEEVAFNTNSHKYHCPSCVWAQKCTRNCITTTLSEAIKRGGIACKVCGGHCK